MSKLQTILGEKIVKGEMVLGIGKKVFKLPVAILILFVIKLVTYYCLIGVNILNNFMVLGSILVLSTLFIVFSRGNWKKKSIWFLFLYAFFSVIMFADTMYYNYYNQTVSVRQIWQASNVAKVPKSFVATLIPASFILLLDIPIVFYFFKKDMKSWMNHKEQENLSRKWVRKTMAYLVSGVAIVMIVLIVNPMDSINVTKVTSVEFFTSHIADICQTVVAKVSAKEVPVKEVLKMVEDYTEGSTQENQGNRLSGIAKGKNLIVIQIESYQNFLIGARYNGKELTPNLNKLLKKDTLYYNNYYSNIGKGNTVDAEFSTLNSLYPVIDGESYRLFVDNTYNGLPWQMKEEGYSALAIHGYEGAFWNREEAYPYQGFDEFYSMEDLKNDEVIGLGISDRSVYNQTIEILKKQKEPYFTFLVTLTNHHPYFLPKGRKDITLLPEHENTKFGSYLQTSYYTDETLGEFINALKKEGLYEDTVIALYGDHHGLNCNMDDNGEIVGDYLGRKYDYDEMFRVPLMIHIPGSGVNETVETLGGQVDFLPTIANLFDFKIEQPYILGQDLNNAEEGFVAFTAYLFDGSFVKDNIMFEISREGIFEGSRAWRRGTEEEVHIQQCEEGYQRALSLKGASREILEQDLIADYVTHRRTIQHRE